jgi:hypothetical protein
VEKSKVDGLGRPQGAQGFRPNTARRKINPIYFSNHLQIANQMRFKIQTISTHKNKLQEHSSVQNLQQHECNKCDYLIQ